MLCEKCKNENEIVRGIKQITCLDCYKEVIVSSNYNANICHDCSDKTRNCVKCGALIESYNMNRLYMISHYDWEGDYNEIPTFSIDKLTELIEIYKEQKKENGICISIFEIDKGKIYSQCYKYSDNVGHILDDCINMKDKCWDC